VTQVPTSVINGGNRPLPTCGGLLFICRLTNGGWNHPSRKVSCPKSKISTKLLRWFVAFICTSTNQFHIDAVFYLFPSVHLYSPEWRMESSSTLDTVMSQAGAREHFDETG